MENVRIDVGSLAHNTSSTMSIESIMTELEKSNNHIGELIRVQNELSTCQNELLALQIRFVHKNRENEELKAQLDLKSKAFNQTHLEIECKQERMESLEFHYNELIQKHKLCLECMSKQRDDNETLKAVKQDLEETIKKLEKEKTQLQDIFKDQIEDLDLNLKKLIEENDKNVRTIKDLRGQCNAMQNELEASSQANAELVESKRVIESEISMWRTRLERASIAKQSSDDQINQLQVELAQLKSKLDESHLQLLEFKNLYLNQLKIREMVEKNSEKREAQLNELQFNYESCVQELKSLSQANSAQRREYEIYLKDLQVQVSRDKCDGQVVEKVKEALLEQHARIDQLIESHQSQDDLIKQLKLLVDTFRARFAVVKGKLNDVLFKSYESDVMISELQEKCCDLENKYLQKCEHLNSLEREIYLTKNSLDSAVHDLSSSSHILKVKCEEILVKNQTIDRLESIISQLNIELNKRKSEINERITQIEILDKHVKEEKSSFDLRISHLEASLKTKSKQLHQRIEQIKDMSELVNKLKEEKDQVDYKLEQMESQARCQKMEIESKSLLIKQLELRVQDSQSELNGLKASQIVTKESKESQASNVGPTMTCKSINTDSSFIMFGAGDEQLVDKTEFEDLKLNMKVKESLIESINDGLILKDAEIARLKARLAALERKCLAE